LQQQIQVRYAERNDAAVLARLFAAVVGPLDIYVQRARDGEIKRFSEHAFRSLIGNDARSVALAFADEEAVGFSIAEDQCGPVWIEWYGVIAHARGKGAGRALIKSLIDEAPGRKATKLWCDTRTNNTPSIALFESIGFRKLCELKQHWYGQDFFLWERDV